MPTTLSTDQITSLVAQARAAQAKAYAPYSTFKVGAALLSADGQVFLGANVENSSFGLTICAERSAACSAVSSGAQRFLAIAIVSSDAAAPCGACRQFLWEFGDMTVALSGPQEDSPIAQHQLSDLLPEGFRLE